ncbi:hypothetical protein ACFSSG_14960 [Euzebyella marina]|uniref:hypothetical protein n=1 Tax=Euzebyella marina TaxID=1761453 RepID=UPI0017818F3D|nr:hypothetical protein [Euzebyella marina]|tara:strand:- start:147 stop:803 length:657 start_codon:yes stop_codon:yes gene_type:complete
MGEKKIVRRKLILEGVIALIITVSPIIFYSYKYLPFNEDETWSFLGMHFTDNGYGEISMAFYFYLSKIIPLVLLIIWFSTCKRWWYHAILIPIAMYSFQLYSVLVEDIKKIDENEIMYLLGVCMVVIPIVYFIRIKLVDKYVHGIDLEAMEAELKELKDKQAREKAKKLKLQSNEDVMDEEILPSISEELDEKLSTHKIGSKIKEVQGQLNDWLQIKS